MQRVCSLFRSGLAVSVKNALDQQWDCETAGGFGKFSCARLIVLPLLALLRNKHWCESRVESMDMFYASLACFALRLLTLGTPESEDLSML